MTREVIDGEEQFAVREVYYDDAGKVANWTADPCSFAGDTAQETADSISLAAGCLAYGVLDLETRETIRPKP
jgi:hypothetical protein